MRDRDTVPHEVVSTPSLEACEPWLDVNLRKQEEDAEEDAEASSQTRGLPSPSASTAEEH